MKKSNRYKVTIDKNGLGDYESKLVEYTFKSSSPEDALRRIDVVKDTCYKNGKRIPYHATLYLEALAISAETDLHFKD
jgi:hypothetical protein